MKGEKPFRILGLVDDGPIEAAEVNKPARKQPNKTWLKWVTVAVCAVLVIGGIWYLNNPGIFPADPPDSSQEGSGHAQGSDFMHYTGPVLPLNVAGDTGGINAKRSVHFDFTAYETEQRDLWVTDTYSLTNNTDKDKTFEVFYPFISSIVDSKEFTPMLRINGEGLQTQLLLGDYVGGFTGIYSAEGPDNTTYNLVSINSWEGYKALLENGRYFEIAQGEKAFADQRVTVYTFHDVTYPEEYDAATLAIEFDLPQGSRVITYGMNGAAYEDGSSRHQYDYFVRHAMEQKVIILGEPPAEYTVQGYEDGACERKVDGIKGTVKTETRLLSEVIKDCIAEHLTQYSDLDTVSPLVTDELIFRGVVSMFQYTVLGDAPKDRYEWMRLDDLIHESYVLERVMYLTAQVTVPAGRSVEIESRFIKGASYDFIGAGPEENQGVMGYDMMTKLGSGLEFGQQKASISLPQTYEIILQNFSFDPTKDMTEVDLDISQERYYLEIKEKSGTDK